MMHSFLAALLLISLQSTYAFTHSDSINFAVGFQSVVITDYSRSYNTTLNPSAHTFKGRPIQINLWYPAKPAKTAKRITVGEYRLLSNVEASLSDWTESERKNAVKNLIASSPDSVRTFLETSTTAALDAPMVDGKFPLIIYSPSMLGNAVGNTVLCEYLATRGYIIAAHPSFGDAPKMMDTGQIGLETQIRDIEFVLAYTKTKFQDRINFIGIIGHSWGGMAAGITAMRHPDVQAVISLDGSQEVWRDLVVSLPDYDVTKLRMPFMHIETHANSRHGYYESIQYAPKYRISFPTLDHFDVVSSDPSNNGKEDSKKQLYEKVNEFIAAFVDSYLKNRPASFNALVQAKTEEIGIEVQKTAAIAPPPSHNEVVTLFISGKADEAEKIIRETKAKNPEAYSEKELLQIGELVFWSWKHFPEALQIFQLAGEYYPESPRIMEMLGNVYSSTDKKAEALKYYRCSFQLDPKNLRIQGYIDSISKSGSASTGDAE